MELELVFMSIICLVAIMIVSFYIYFSVEATKKYVRDELSRFATLVNDAQYNEFVFDKQNEKNIVGLETRLKELDKELKALNNMVQSKK
jgi:hypothetical protein